MFSFLLFYRIYTQTAASENIHGEVQIHKKNRPDGIARSEFSSLQVSA